MKAEEMKKSLKSDIVKKYERFKYKAAVAYHNGEISSDDLRLRKKFINREENIRLKEIDEMSAYKIRKLYKEKNDPQIDDSIVPELNPEIKKVIDSYTGK